MRKLNALFLVFLVSVLSPSLHARPHFQVFEENASLFIKLKTKGLLERVAQEVNQLSLGYCKDKIVVLNSQPPEFLIQFFEFFASRQFVTVH